MSFFGGLRKRDILHFFEYLTDTLEVGLSVQDSVARYVPLRKKNIMRFRILNNNLKKGVALSRALEKAGIGDFAVVSIVESGEASGNLLSVCREISSSLSEDIRFRTEVRKMMTLPTIEAVAAIAVAMFALVKVVPNVASSLQGIGELPEFSRKVFAISLAVKNHFALIVAGIIASPFLVYQFVREKKLNYYLYSIPLIKNMLMYSFASRFFYQLTTLLAGGIMLLPAIKRIRQASRSSYERTALSYIIANLQKGMNFDDAIKRCSLKLFPDDVVNILGVVNITGNYRAVSEKLTEMTRQKLRTSMMAFVSLVEPAIIVLLGIIVFVIVMTVYYPIVGMTTKM